MKLEWNRGIGWLKEKWADFTGFFAENWSKAVYWTAEQLTKAWGGLELAWSGTVGFLSDAWTAFNTAIQKTWFSTIGFIQKAWVRLKSLFDSDINVNAETKDIDNATNALNRDADKKRDATISAREKARSDEQHRIISEGKGAIDQLGQMQDAEVKARAAKREAAEKELTDKLKSLMVERDGLLQTAADEANNAANDAERDKNDRYWKAKQAKKGGETLVEIGKGFTAGTFNGSRAGQILGGVSPLLEQQKITNQHLALFGRKLNKLEVAPLNFGA